MNDSRIFILTCILCGCLGSCRSRTQPPPLKTADKFRLVKLHYENSAGEKGVTHFYYDLNGDNYLAIWHLEDSSRSSLNHHSFDTAGRMTVKSRAFSDGINSVQHFKYDPDGNLASEDFSRSDGVSGQVNYFYSPDGRLEYADCRGLNGWFYGMIQYEWEEGRKKGAVLTRDSLGIGSIVYEYLDNRLVREHWDFNGNWSQTFGYEYQEAAPLTFTSSNVFIREDPWFRLGSEFYEFNGETGGPSHYTYDESGKLTVKEYIRSDGLGTTSTYVYDSTGRLDVSHREYADGRTADFNYWYGMDRNLLVKTFKGSDGTSGSETYRYEDGKLIQGEWVNVDGWLSGTLEFGYGENAVPVSAAFSGRDGLGAVVHFDHDLNYNLVKIHWEFSSGQTQTYFFEYEPN